jgi:hypothetical protein
MKGTFSFSLLTIILTQSTMRIGKKHKVGHKDQHKRNREKHPFRPQIIHKNTTFSSASVEGNVTLAIRREREAMSNILYLSFIQYSQIFPQKAVKNCKKKFFGDIIFPKKFRNFFNMLFHKDFIKIQMFH